MIEVSGLTKKFGDFIAVENVSFSVPKGQIVGLLGHNGAGKTTILRMITGYLEPCAGIVRIDGEDITSSPLRARKKIGYLPENCPLYSEMMVAEYLNYIAELRGISENTRPKLLREAIARTELSDRILSPIATLSKGLRQRVGVAQAMIEHSPILILDEPTSGLDPSQIHQMRNLIQELSRQATVILSTHILQEVEAVCHRVIIIDRAKLVLDSTLEELKKSDSLDLWVDCSPAALKQSLKDLTGVEGIDLVERAEPSNHYTLRLTSEPHVLAPRIARALVEGGFQLHELKQNTRTLDSVFRELDSVQGGKNA